MPATPAAPEQEMFSTRASNIIASDTESDIAPMLPTPEGGVNATPVDLLRSARDALTRRQTGLAQEALERAETRLLTRPLPPGAMMERSHNPMVNAIIDARHALGRQDIKEAEASVREALELSGQT